MSKTTIYLSKDTAILSPMIKKGKVAHDSIEINIIEPEKTDKWQIRKVTYNEQDYLVNWQLGFFD